MQLVKSVEQRVESQSSTINGLQKTTGAIIYALGLLSTLKFLAVYKLSTS